ncbi:MAG: hypothetical protein RJQ04_11335 [Longimicrobiales bacterium]
MDIDLALLADAATVDGAGKLNILGIFDRLGAGSFPARHPRMALVLRFSAGIDETGAHEVEIVLRDPDGGEVVRMSGDLTLGPGPGTGGNVIRVPHVLNLDGLVFPKAGSYGFDVKVDGAHHVTVPLTVAGPARQGVGAQA